MELENQQQFEIWYPDYSFVKVIGSGSYGVVYSALRKTDGLKVAIKVVCVCKLVDICSLKMKMKRKKVFIPPFCVIARL